MDFPSLPKYPFLLGTRAWHRAGPLLSSGITC